MHKYSGLLALSSLSCSRISSLLTRTQALLSLHLSIIMFGSRLYLISAISIAITAVSAIPRPLGNSTAPVLPQRNATTGQRVNSTSSANNTVPVGFNTTINNVTITGTNGAQAACDRGLTQFCTSAAPAPTARAGKYCILVPCLNTVLTRVWLQSLTLMTTSSSLILV